MSFYPSRETIHIHCLIDAFRNGHPADSDGYGVLEAVVYEFKDIIREATCTADLETIIEKRLKSYSSMLERNEKEYPR